MTKLKDRRETAKLSQTGLAKASGVPVRMIRAYEAEAESSGRDINRAEARKVWMLAQALGCSVGDILEPVQGDNK